MIAVCQNGIRDKSCTTADKLSTALNIGWARCSTVAGGGGEAFDHVTLGPLGNWLTTANPAARPAPSWGFDA
jgi:hypothetical protein